MTKETTERRLDRCRESSTSLLRKVISRHGTAARHLQTTDSTERKSVASAALIATPLALAVIHQLVGEVGPITFFLSRGQFPMCFVDTEFVVRDYDVLLVHVGGCRFYLDCRQYDTWRNAQIELDIREGPPSDFWLS